MVWCWHIVSAQQMLVEKLMAVQYRMFMFLFLAIQRTNFWSPYILDFIKLVNSNSFGDFLQVLYPVEIVGEVPVLLSRAQNEICCSALMFSILYSKIIGDYKSCHCHKPGDASPDRLRAGIFSAGPIK